jgi:hypothetical protein
MLLLTVGSIGYPEVHFHDFIGNLLSRPDLEGSMDKACDNLKSDLGNPPPDFVNNVWQVEFLRTFEGHMPGTLFIDRQEEGCYGVFITVVRLYNQQAIQSVALLLLQSWIFLQLARQCS